MSEQKLVTLVQLRQFLDGTQEVGFRGCGNDRDRYQHIEAVVRRFGYRRLKRTDKGVIVRYLQRTTGYSRQQLTRLIRRAYAGPLRKRYRAPTQGFARRFTDAEVALLAATDTLHGTLSGPATRHLMQRALRLYGDTRYARLATISTAHLYNLRKRTGYVDRRREWTKTRPSPVMIGERRAPAPDGRPGFIRIDSVHQGDQDGVKGVYHLNAVDCLTQWELVATCEKISEAFLLPVLETLLAGFPFHILGFHADNGSEYHLNPYLNFHRPCLFAEEITDTKGRIRKRYPQRSVMTPLEKLATVPKVQRFLRRGISLASLRRHAAAISDNEAAARLNEARSQLFLSIHKRSRNVA